MMRKLNSTLAVRLLLCAVACYYVAADGICHKMVMQRCECGRCVPSNVESDVCMSTAETFHTVPGGGQLLKFGSVYVNHFGVLFRRHDNSLYYHNYTDEVHVLHGDVIMANITNDCRPSDGNPRLNIKTPNVHMTVDSSDANGHIQVGCRLKNETENRFLVSERMITDGKWSIDYNLNTFTLDNDHGSTTFDIAQRNILSQRGYVEWKSYMDIESSCPEWHWSRTASNGDHIIIYMSDVDRLNYIVNDVTKVIVSSIDKGITVRHIYDTNVQFDTYWRPAENRVTVHCGNVSMLVTSKNPRRTVVYNNLDPLHAYEYWPYLQTKKGERNMFFRYGPLQATITSLQ